jgi:hypothetical protein
VLAFHVDSIDPDGLVIGRNDDFDIPVGTTFSNIRLCRVHKTNDEYQTEDLGNIAAVSLTLREVHWYRKSIEFIPRGHTAGLRVDGEGMLELAEQLRNLRPGDCVALTASPSYIAEHLYGP